MSFSISFPSSLSSPLPNLNPKPRHLRLSFDTSFRFLFDRRKPLSSGHRRLFFVRARAKDLVLGNPVVTVEKGKYSYDVETLINKLSSLLPRGSIARCLDIFKNKFSLNDFALVFKEFATRGDWQRSLRLFKYMQRQMWCKPSEHIYTIVISLLGRESKRERERALEK